MVHTPAAPFPGPQTRPRHCRASLGSPRTCTSSVRPWWALRCLELEGRCCEGKGTQRGLQGKNGLPCRSQCHSLYLPSASHSEPSSPCGTLAQLHCALAHAPFQLRCPQGAAGPVGHGVRPNQCSTCLRRVKLPGEPEAAPTSWSPVFLVSSNVPRHNPCPGPGAPGSAGTLGECGGHSPLRCLAWLSRAEHTLGRAGPSGRLARQLTQPAARCPPPSWPPWLCAVLSWFMQHYLTS